MTNEIYEKYKHLEVKSLNQLPDWCTYFISLGMQFKRYRIPSHIIRSEFKEVWGQIELLVDNGYIIKEHYNRDNNLRLHSLQLYYVLTEKAMDEYNNPKNRINNVNNKP